jgi:hypothetical protein
VRRTLNLRGFFAALQKSKNWHGMCLVFRSKNVSGLSESYNLLQGALQVSVFGLPRYLPAFPGKREEK